MALLAVLIVATVLDNRLRRSALQATHPPGLSRTAPRKVLRDQRAQNRVAQARFAAEHPYLNTAVTAAAPSDTGPANPLTPTHHRRDSATQAGSFNGSRFGAMRYNVTRPPAPKREITHGPRAHQAD